MRKEYLVKRKVRAILKELNAWYCMPAGTGYGASGVLDFIGCYAGGSRPGRLTGIETKSGGNQPTALQYKCMKEIEEAGGRTIVIDELNINQLKEWIES